MGSAMKPADVVTVGQMEALRARKASGAGPGRLTTAQRRALRELEKEEARLIDWADNGTPQGASGGADAPHPIFFEFMDTSVALRLYEEVISGRYIWVAGLGWHRWTGKRWKGCGDVGIAAKVAEAVREWAVAYLRDADAERAKKCVGLNAEGKVAALCRLLRGHAEIEMSLLDADPDLFNVANGVLNLRTGQLEDHDTVRMRGVFITKLSEVAYVEDAHVGHGSGAITWRRALEAVPADVREWLRVRLGQALTGHPPEDDMLPLLHGSGANGKSSFLGAVAAAAGEYSVLLDDKVILGDPGGHSTELMDLRGARLAWIEELPEGRYLNVTRLKKIMGTNVIRARRMRQDPVEFAVTHSLFVNTNYKPIVTETDHGTWRRLALVSFPYTFRKGKEKGEPLRNGTDKLGNVRLRAQLRRGRAREAVLSWLVSGAMAWYEAGKEMAALPARIETDTAGWRGQVDLIEQFWDEVLVADAGRHVDSGHLHTVFMAWCKDKGYSTMVDRIFRARMETHERTRGAEVRYEETRRVDSEASEGMPDWTTLSLPGGEWIRLNVSAHYRYRSWTGVRFGSEIGGSAGD